MALKTGITFAAKFVLMKMKLFLFIAGLIVLFSSCKARPDQDLVNSMKADIAKYEQAPAFLQQAGKEYADMGNLMLKLPDDVKSQVPHFNEEEAMTWKRYGSKLLGGADGYTQTVASLKLLTADYMDGAIPTDSARVKYQILSASLASIPGPDKIEPDLNAARGSFQQMTASIPAEKLAQLKAETGKEDK